MKTSPNCLVMANDSCPFPHGEYFQAEGTFCRHIPCPIGSVLEQGVPLPCHPERMGKQCDDGQGGNEEREGKG